MFHPMCHDDHDVSTTYAHSHPIPSHSLLHLLEERLSRFFSDFQSRILSNLRGLGPQDRRGTDVERMEGNGERGTDGVCGDFWGV